jgi:transcriptional regulator with XRE-family HTH domain
LGHVLRQHRERIRLTQGELAGLSTVSIRAIRNLELGLSLNPRRQTLLLLADAMRLSGERRASLFLAAGHDADDKTFANGIVKRLAPTERVIGRDREIAGLFAVLTATPQAAIRVTGLGGVGKTRLARCVSDLFATEHRIPSLWITLNDSQVTALGSSWFDNAVTVDEHASENLFMLIRDRCVLVVIDGDDRHQFDNQSLQQVLRRCPNVKVITTSRRPSAVDATMDFPLRPLATDRNLAAGGGDAVDLLRHSIMRLDPTYRPEDEDLTFFTDICERLDGIPRAIAAAASWFPLSSAAELAKMAAHEPLLLATPPTGPSASEWVDDAVCSAWAAMTSHQRQLLVSVTRRHQSWTLEQLIAPTGTGKQDAARALDMLLRTGLVRAVDPNSVRDAGFTVLNIVRPALAALAQDRRRVVA